MSFINLIKKETQEMEEFAQQIMQPSYTAFEEDIRDAILQTEKHLSQLEKSNKTAFLISCCALIVAVLTLIVAIIAMIVNIK